MSARAERSLRGALGLVVGLTAACGASPMDLSTGVAAEVRRGPITPVEQVGMDNTAPVAGATVVVTLGDHVLGRVTTDADGKATINVPAGDYQVAIESCPGAMRVPGPVDTHVASGSLTSVQVICDTGIR